MDFGMWRKVLLVFVFVGNGLSASGNNQEVFKQLCHIAGNVSALMGKNGQAEIHLNEALYGKDRITSFDNSGTFTGGSECGLALHHRSQYCSHMPGGLRFDGHGCFGHSLLGTFLCLCVPGNRNEQDLCGLENVGNGAGWTSWSGHVNSLFQKIGDQVNNRCSKKNVSTVDVSVLLENLKNAVHRIKDETKQRTGKDGYYLGGSNTNGICDGSGADKACVTYMRSGNTAEIPWAEKILTALKTLNASIQKQTSSLNSATQSGPGNNEDHLSDQDKDDEEESEEGEEEEPVKNPSPQDTSKPPRSRRKRRNTNNKPTEQPAEPLRAILHDDGSFLPQPFWLLSAVVI